MKRRRGWLCECEETESESKFIDENPLPIRLGLQTKLPWQLTRIKLPLCLKREVEWLTLWLLSETAAAAQTFSAYKPGPE